MDRLVHIDMLILVHIGMLIWLYGIVILLCKCPKRNLKLSNKQLDLNPQPRSWKINTQLFSQNGQFG